MILVLVGESMNSQNWSQLKEKSLLCLDNCLGMLLDVVKTTETPLHPNPK